MHVHVSSIACIAFIVLIAELSVVQSAPCDIRDDLANNLDSARIEFNEDAEVGTRLFTLPFDGESENDIEPLSVSSSDARFVDYFAFEFKTLVLRRRYDLDELQLDLIELFVTCTSSPPASNNETSDDGSEAPLINKNTYQLYITVNDVNDNEPRFVDAPYSVQMSELAPVGTVVYTDIRALDADLADKPNSQVSYTILRDHGDEEGQGDENTHSCAHYFEFALSTLGHLSVARPIAYDRFARCTLTIRAQDHGTPPLAATTTVSIEVLDVDNKDPAFTRSHYTAFIYRNDPIVSLSSNVFRKILFHHQTLTNLPNSQNTLVNTTQPVLAQDQDTGINASVHYSLDWPQTAGTESKRQRFRPLPFAIDSTNGQIRLVRSLVLPLSAGVEQQLTDDEDDPDSYKLVIKATQTNNVVRVAYAGLSVRLLHVNEHAPVFDSAAYEASVLENAPHAKIVCIVSAHDRDNNRIEFSLRDATTTTNNNNNASSQQPFTIDKTRGIVRLNNASTLDFEKRPLYELVVVASDGNRTAQATLRVHVVNVVDERPRFEHAAYAFTARIPHDLYIGQVS